ncbi:MAG: tetratricopeptide repeat protein [Candidatus Eremiobacteraeota bacterium]|nr:tetratricopeptide repeat protein [Candidatus Eremiobacteraeota bacterium]
MKTEHEDSPEIKIKNITCPVQHPGYGSRYYVWTPGPGILFTKKKDEINRVILFSVILFCFLMLIFGCLKSSTRASPEELAEVSRLLDENDLAGAESALGNIFSKAPGDPDARLLYSRLLLMRNRPGDAVKELSKIRKKKVGNKNIALLLGEAYLEDNRPGEAEIQYKKVLGTNPESPEARLGLARVNLARYMEAEFRKATSCYPLETANLLYIYGNRPLAIKEFERIAEDETSPGPRSFALTMLFRIYLEENRLKDALECLEKATRCIPERLGKQDLSTAINTARKLHDRQKEELFRKLLEKNEGKP